MVTISELKSKDALYCHYQGQTEPQDCYIELDTRDGALSADYNAEIGNAVPSEVYYGHIRRYSIPVLKAETANELMHEIETLAQRVVDGAEIVWNGNNNVTRLSEDAKDAESEIEGVCDRYDDGDSLDVWDAGEWLYEGRKDIIARLKAGESVADLEKEFEADADGEDVVLDGLTHYLENLAEEAAEDDA